VVLPNDCYFIFIWLSVAIDGGSATRLLELKLCPFRFAVLMYFIVARLSPTAYLFLSGTVIRGTPNTPKHG
jgi:hypothetical protein